jgi:hypothetical protein
MSNIFHHPAPRIRRDRVGLRTLRIGDPPFFAICAVIGTFLVVPGFSEEPDRIPPDRQTPVEESGSAAGPIFVDAAKSSGLDFVHFNGMTGELFYNEMMGGGVALFDYDNDGDLDVYLTQGHMQVDAKPMADPRDPTKKSQPLIDRLYRNDLVIGTDGTRTLHFTGVSELSGIRAIGYGMGVATGDYDNDGWVDLYVTNFGSNLLLRNQGDGTFEDVTASSGTDDRNWTIGATFFDFDRDGWLDLFAGNYLEFSLASHTPCPLPSGALTYCGPGAYTPQPDTLFRNMGNGSFQNVSVSAGIRSEPGAGMGVVATDFNGDGWIDFFVTNDGMPNQLWINQTDGTFANDALFAGVAVNQDGLPEASMGVDAEDFDHDGDQDLFLTHLIRETNTVYANDGGGLFEDISMSSGLGHPSLSRTSFGTSWFDYDNDGWLDLLTVSGAVVALEPQLRAGEKYPLAQANQLFHNLGNGRFEETTSAAGDVFELSEVSRGAAFGDIDNDGDVDVVIGNSNGPVRLLLNQRGQDRAWLGIEVKTGGRHALGAIVLVSRTDGTVVSRRVHTDGSYASASDPRVLIGLGNAPTIAWIEVRWPDGLREKWTDVKPGRYTVLKRGQGRVEEKVAN